MTKDEAQKSKRIISRYGFWCSGICRKRYPASTVAYWKRETDPNGVPHTSILCADCFRNRKEE